MTSLPFSLSSSPIPTTEEEMEEDFYIYYGEDYLEAIVGNDNLEQSTSAVPMMDVTQNDRVPQKVPKDVVKVLIHPRVKVIPSGAFTKCERLQQVQFGFFGASEKGMGRIVGDQPSPLQCDCLLEVIGEAAFSHCVSLKHIALPPSLKLIRKSAFEGCLTLLSAELCHGLVSIEDRAFWDCYGLKNVAIPNTVEPIDGASVVVMRNYNSLDDQVDDDESEEEDSLEAPLVRSLRKRFQNLPIHHLCYYFHQLYPNYDGIDKQAIVELVENASKSACDGKSTDAFGMTPLHIFACSARPHPKLLQVLLDLIYYHDDSSNDAFAYSVLTKDSWGNYPIHYAVRCNAPLAMVKLLIDAQLVHHSDANLQSDTEEQPLHLRHRRKEPPYWKGLLDLACNLASLPMTKFLIESSINDRIEALQCQAWKEDVLTMIDSYRDESKQDDAMEKRQLQTQPKALTAPRSRQQLIKAVEKRLEWYKFQEPLSLLELAVWKTNLQSDTSNSSGTDEDQTQFRENCRMHCGGEVVTMNVLEFWGNFETQQMNAWKKKKRSIPLLPTPNPWGTVPALRHL